MAPWPPGVRPRFGPKLVVVVVSWVVVRQSFASNAVCRGNGVKVLGIMMAEPGSDVMLYQRNSGAAAGDRRTAGRGRRERVDMRNYPRHENGMWRSGQCRR